jgi:hypothetical protein
VVLAAAVQGDLPEQLQAAAVVVEQQSNMFT